MGIDPSTQVGTASPYSWEGHSSWHPKLGESSFSRMQEIWTLVQSLTWLFNTFSNLGKSHFPSVPQCPYLENGSDPSDSWKFSPESLGREGIGSRDSQASAWEDRRATE